jgi:hypothetical protein
MQLVFPRGFSMNFVLITWALFGGLFIYAFFRTMQTSTIRSILQIICKAHPEKCHSAGTFEQNNANLDQGRQAHFLTSEYARHTFR